MNKMSPFLWIALGLSLLLAALVSPFASSSPDGLERVAEDQGFLTRAETPGATVWESAPIPDYALPGIGNEKVATAAAGLIGVTGTFVLVYGVALLLRRKNTSPA